MELFLFVCAISEEVAVGDHLSGDNCTVQRSQETLEGEILGMVFGWEIASREEAITSERFKNH